jgi:hypothetical protein
LEEEFSESWRNYERSLEEFRGRFHAVGRGREASLGEGEGAARRELLSRIDRYVQETAAEVEDTGSRVRRSLDADREALVAERNGLPWE